ncbi:hypothetical protein MKW98_005692 [Papaver atlanticum]|uniref:RecA family profile 2 domain-containing protein n=1 Tax=Papaver atlanticum TaxID=357466 RepID=A0AAD4SMU2_9MAGN|nr:hypothetical protein MKW98_005692 [Papaver atlanticum]
MGVVSVGVIGKTLRIHVAAVTVEPVGVVAGIKKVLVPERNTTYQSFQIWTWSFLCYIIGSDALLEGKQVIKITSGSSALGELLVIDDSTGGLFIYNLNKPAGGHILGHAASIRLTFRKRKGRAKCLQEKKLGEILPRLHLGVIGALTLSVTFFVVTVICNRALMSNLGSPFSKGWEVPVL